MQEAYLEYEEVTGNILGVHWIEPINSWIKIDGDLAISFMNGSKKPHLHRVVTDDNGSPFLDVFKERFPIPAFREQLPDNISDNVRIKINKASVTVTLVHNISHNIGLFVTLKNDPTWLVDSFNVTRLLNESGKLSMNIKIPNAASYSYHIGAIDEI